MSFLYDASEVVNLFVLPLVWGPAVHFVVHPPAFGFACLQQEQAVPMCWQGTRPAWLNREFWLELRKKRRVPVIWKKGQATREDCNDVVRLCREKVKRAKAPLDLSLATAVKDNKKCFYKYISNKRRVKENLHPLLDVGGNLVTKDEEKAEVLSAAFASVFNSKGSCSLDTQPPEQQGRDGEWKETPIIQGEMVSDPLHHVDTHRSVGPVGIHPRVLKELVDVFAQPLSVICQQSWLTGEVPVDWKSANVTPIYRQGQKEDLGNYGPVRLTSLPGKVMEQIILSAITRHTQDNQGIRPCQHESMKSKS